MTLQPSLVVTCSQPLRRSYTQPTLSHMAHFGFVCQTLMTKVKLLEGIGIIVLMNGTENRICWLFDLILFIPVQQGKGD